MKKMFPRALVLAALGQLTCHQAILVAPPGSTLELIANPEFIAANGDVSVITAVIYEPAGTPVADGTVVQFFTNLGKIQEQGKTNDGVARVNFTSDSRSGEATISAISGSGSAPSPAPTGSPTGQPTPPGQGGGGGQGVTIASGVTVAAASGLRAADSVVVRIGSATPTAVFVLADPPRITDSRTSQIVANVLDDNGNGIANVPVFFETNGTFEFMESGTNAVFTDSSGRARAVLRTRYGRDQPQRTVTVTATTANGVSDSVNVVIN